MLSKRRCPHTGVVNFFSAADPHMAVGSVIKSGQTGYLWRCYADPFEIAGSVEDMKAAEHCIVQLYRQAAGVAATRALVNAA